MKIIQGKNGGIYKIYFNSTSKVYVGSAVDFEKRKYRHLYLLKNNKHYNVILQRLYNKDNNILFEILENIPEDKMTKSYLIKKEQFWIEQLKPEINILKKAYTSLGYRHSQEVLEKLKLINKEIANRPEVKTITAKTQFKQGVKLSGDRLEKLQNRMKINNPFKGKFHNLETKNLMSLKAKKPKRIEQARQNIAKIHSLDFVWNRKQVLIEKNGLETVFKSISELEKFLGLKTNGNLRRKLQQGKYFFKKHNFFVSYV